MTAAKELAPGGSLSTTKQFNWVFRAVDKPYDSYSGKNVTVRYFVRSTVFFGASSATKEVELLVRNQSQPPSDAGNLKMEVGIDDCLHIEFEYNKSAFDLRDVILGRVFFYLAKIRLKHMELDILRVETVNTGSRKKVENETLSKFEIMDGSPVRMESVPVRMFLGGNDLGPTMQDVLNTFSVRYFLNLVLVDEDERRYFKKQEVTLYRA